MSTSVGNETSALAGQRRLGLPAPGSRMRRWQGQVVQIRELEKSLQAKTDRELRKESLSLRYRAKSGESPQRFLVDAYALVREAAVRRTKDAALRRADVGRNRVVSQRDRGNGDGRGQDLDGHPCRSTCTRCWGEALIWRRSTTTSPSATPS